MQNYVYLFVWYYCRYCAFGIPTDINIHWNNSNNISMCHLPAHNSNSYQNFHILLFFPTPYACYIAQKAHIMIFIPKCSTPKTQCKLTLCGNIVLSFVYKSINKLRWCEIRTANRFSERWKNGICATCCFSFLCYYFNFCVFSLVIFCDANTFE